MCMCVWLAKSRVLRSATNVEKFLLWQQKSVCVQILQTNATISSLFRLIEEKTGRKRKMSEAKEFHFDSVLLALAEQHKEGVPEVIFITIFDFHTFTKAGFHQSFIDTENI